jgi:hypothetical protein
MVTVPPQATSIEEATAASRRSENDCAFMPF